jgi:DNA repair exonuclease SbcCD nuclease subunit
VQPVNKPIAVVTGDIHFTTQSLELASAATLQMIKKAAELSVPVIFNGDTLDGKAIIRAECANRLIDLISKSNVEFVVNVGNHDLCHQRSGEHSLNFLKPYCRVVDSVQFVESIGSYVVPYQNETQDLLNALRSVEKNSKVFLHQGVQSAYLGHYTRDTSSVTKEQLSAYRVIGSHYHRRQDIKCGKIEAGNVGLFSYLGSPYSQSFGEASDGEKGFSVLYDDGSLELVPTNLRRHIVIETNADGCFDPIPCLRPDDLVWFKVSDTASNLARLSKQEIGKRIFGHSNFKLDKICTDTPEANKKEGMTNVEILDSLIDSTGETKEQKTRLKKLARELLNETAAS